jgi:hypothetical protein
MEILRTTTKPKYCAVGLYLVGENNPIVMMTNGKVVLFDTKVIAQQFMPQLGAGRLADWSADGEYLFFHPLKAQGFNKACVITAWDPYNLPAGMPDHIRSETPGREWRCHIMWSHAFTDCGPGHWVQNSDGVLVNTALGEYQPAASTSPGEYQPVATGG